MNSDADLGSAAPIEALPELPEAGYAVNNVTPIYYTADQMREYARQAALAERERCARIAEAVWRQDCGTGTYEKGWTGAAALVAATIRAGKPHP